MPSPSIELLPRQINRQTRLDNVAIIYPASDPCYRDLADTLAVALAASGVTRPECVTDLALMPERSIPLPDTYRSRTLIVLGNLNTNRTLQPLYANFLCSTDATYPGGNGFDLRTLVNPYGTGTNLVLAGGSNLRGVERAVAKLLEAIADAGETKELPWLFAVELEPALATNLAAWPYTPLEDSAELQALRSRGLMFYTEPIRVIGAYTMMWSWTADERYARIAVDALRRLNASMTTGYGDWHYLAERFLRAIPLLIAGGLLTDEEITRTDDLLLQTAYGNEDEWWRVKVGHPPLGHRHQGKGTYEFLLLARYLRDQVNATPTLRKKCDQWIAECCSFLDALAAARLDDQDDESSLNNLATLYRYALGQERHDFFTSGNARLVAERCLALHDNNGNGAGQGGYGESQGMYLQQEATEQTACSAFYYGDGTFKWILQTMPNLEIAQRYVFLRYVPVFLQKFDTGPELEPVAPPRTQNLYCLPVTDHQLAISNHPPEHVVPEGHMINAPETWQLPEAVGLNHLPQERGFDKLVLRAGYARADAYLLIQGYQGGFRWQGHMQAANCIVRFYQAGHIWLVQNTSRHSYHDKNGLLISDGANNTPMPPIAERVALSDFPKIALTATRVNDYHHTDWTRHLYWSKPGGGFFVVIDRVTFKADGPYSLTCSWRTPGYAELHGRHWHSDQGQHRFRLVSGSPVAATCEIDTDQGACSPYVLRQRRAGDHRAGDEGSFQNLFTVRALDDDEHLDLQRLDERSALVRRNDQPLAWCAADIDSTSSWLTDASAQAVSIFIGSDSLTFAGLTKLNMLGLAWQSDQPVGLQIDLTAGSCNLQTSDTAKTTLVFDGGTVDRDRPIPPAFYATLTSKVAAWLASLPSATKTTQSPESAPPAETNSFRSDWTYDSSSRVPEIVRNVRITADPLPVNGSPDEMLDPVMPDGYSRETWIQWPKAAHYSISLTLPQSREVRALNILGDCIDDPTLRTFHPLPAGITVEAESGDGTVRSCVVSPVPDRRYKRYRDAENRLAAHSAVIGEKVRAVHVRLPAPADGSPFVLHRLEVLGDQTHAPAIERWCTADIDGDGNPEIILSNSLCELIVLDQNGSERWRHKLPVPITHISAQPINPAGPPVLCVGMLGGDLHLYNPDGSPQQQWPVAKRFLERKDCLQGWFNATHCINIWRREADGRGCLVLGGYAILVYLDAAGEIVGHSFADGPWLYDIMVAPETRPDRGDLYVRCGWNHGIMYYPGVPGDGPSGEVYHLGGFNQPMFRMLKHVIPFLNGRSLAAAWIDLASLPEGALFFATELGCGVLSTARKDWQWKLEGGMSLNAAILGRIEGKPVALLGGVDGFIAAINLPDGQVIRRLHVGAPVIGLAQNEAGALLVTTSTGVQALDANWQSVGRITRAINRAIPLGENRLLVSHTNHTLELLELA
ncbi:MAG: hypothetical protein K9N01_01785 [Cephaloticoccus sp.]|nr:hypothetical protein [Cephaloticoccus sp.]